VKPAVYVRTMLRESRGAFGRLAFFVACLAVGVAAVVAVAGLSASLDDGLRAEARQLLAADLRIEGSRPLPPGIDLARVGLAGARRTDILEMVTVVASPAGKSQLVELKVIDGDYPFYGKLVLAPARPLKDLLGPESAVVAPELLSGLGLKVGDRLEIGGQGFRIAGQVLSEPDHISISLTLGPRVFLSAPGLARTALAGRGSRIDRKTLIQLPPGVKTGELTAAVERLRKALPNPSFYRIETYKEGQPALRENFRRVGRFLGLVALLSLFVGGIGVAQSVRAWLASRLDAVAIFKCLGVRPREILTLYLGQTALLGLLGSLVGMVLGVAVQMLLPHLFPDLIPGELIRPFQPVALLRGLALGLGVAVLFSLPPLAGVLRVPAARVLRRDAEPLPLHRSVGFSTGLALVGGIFAMASVQSESLLRGLQFTGGVLLVTAALAGAALGITRAVGRLPRGFARLSLRHGLAALGRPGAGTVGAIVALGLGVLTVLGMSLVERRLSSEMSAELPAGAPSAFLVDIQPDQWQGVEGLLHQAGATRIESVPVVMARITAIDGKGVEQIAARPRGEERGGRRWALTREQRLTYMDRLPEDNVVVAGKLWNDPNTGAIGATGRPEVSLEEGFARDLNVGLGSVLSFDIQGVPINLTVTSLRRVDWKTFGINFFLVVEPGVLENAPQQRLAVAHLPPGGEQRVQDLLAARYPNVTVLRLREILEKIIKVLRRISLGIRFLGGFTVVAGVAILAGAISATAGRRGREVALLKTLGMTRKGVAASFAVEYALIGLVAGVIGTAGATVLAWAVVTQGFEMRWEFPVLPLVLAVAGSIVLTITAGLAASARALERRPVEVLRGE
jgi:putative ABC transport system permease protein